LRPPASTAEPALAGPGGTAALPGSPTGQLPAPTAEPVGAAAGELAPVPGNGEPARDALLRQVATIVAERPEEAIRVVRGWLNER
jgi:flagellar biosynthesis/type III secretory pathway M-ring protein FliF/YscJ